MSPPVPCKLFKVIKRTWKNTCVVTSQLIAGHWAALTKAKVLASLYHPPMAWAGGVTRSRDYKRDIPAS